MPAAGRRDEGTGGPGWHAIVLLAAVAGAHAGTIALARAISRSTTEGVPLWAAAGVTASVLLLSPRSLWTPVLFVTFATNVTGNLILDIQLDTAIGGAIANTVEPFLGAHAVLRTLGVSPTLDDRRHLLVFIAGACAGGPAVGALIGAGSIMLVDGHPAFADVLGRWFVGDALGVLVVGSLILAWWRPGTSPIASRHVWTEAIVAGSSIVALSVLAFWGSSPVLAYVVLPPLAFTAIRFGTRGAALGGLAVAIIADWATIRGHGLFVELLGEGEHEALWQLQLFLAVVLVASLVLAVQVSELEAAQRAIRASEEQERIATLLEASPDPVLVVRPDSTVVYVNDQLLGMMRRTRDELLDERFVDFINADRRDRVLEILVHMREQPIGSRSTFEMVGLGEVLDRALEVAVSPLGTLDGIVLVATIRDITASKAAEAELRSARDVAEAATSAKTEFLATMSHEIRTPMSAVTNLIELLSHTSLDVDQRSLLDTMRRSSGSLLQIIDDTLDLSKIEAGRLEIESVALALEDELGAVAALMKPVASTKGLALRSGVEPSSPPLLLGDPLRLRQVLLNLVGNALKFTDAGLIEVHVRVGARSTDGRADVVITVRDTGVGIEPSRQAELFRPFTQASEDTSRRYGGTGLGLSIVRRLVDLMDGSIELTSAPGAGSTFVVTLRLPVAPAGSSATAIGRLAEPDRERFAGHVALVVDDNVVNRDVMVRQLALLGCAAELAADGHAALELLDRGGISLVLTDCNMPGMDGFDLTRTIRQRELASATRRMAVVAVTANAMSSEEERCLAAGMDGYLAKPVPIGRLAQVLDALLPDEPVRPTAALDLTVLREIIGDDELGVLRALDTFASVVREATREIGAAITEGDAVAVRSAAHRIVGAARSVGAGRLASLACVIEIGASTGGGGSLRPALRWVIEETDAITTEAAALAADG